MRPAGYTLIELLVVISIIGILSVVAFVNIKDFSSAQALKKAAGEVQSLLRLAQANASSSTLCNNVGGVSWTVKFNTDSTVQIKCGPADYPIKTLTLQTGITIESPIKTNCDLTLPVTIVYSALKGVPTIPGSTCWSGADVIIKLVNPKSEFKRLFFTSGGAINVE